MQEPAQMSVTLVVFRFAADRLHFSFAVEEERKMQAM
jgi:hypothetical protein